jgi:uncharacterized protein (DUF983 family)
MRVGMLKVSPIDTKAPSPLLVALRGLCPRCGAGTLFQGLAAFAPSCRGCGLDLSQFNVGDGPAALLILVIGALTTGLAITVDLRFGPPWWVHVLLWVPVTAIAVVGALRFAKALLLALEWSGRHAIGVDEDGRGPSSPDHAGRHAIGVDEDGRGPSSLDHAGRHAIGVTEDGGGASASEYRPHEGRIAEKP